jgi:hypothetical protein
MSCYTFLGGGAVARSPRVARVTHAMQKNCSVFVPDGTDFLRVTHAMQKSCSVFVLDGMDFQFSDHIFSRCAEEHRCDNKNYDQKIRPAKHKNTTIYQDKHIINPE